MLKTAMLFLAICDAYYPIPSSQLESILIGLIAGAYKEPTAAISASCGDFVIGRVNPFRSVQDCVQKF